MNAIEKISATTATEMSRTTRGVCTVWLSSRRHLICARAENA